MCSIIAANKQREYDLVFLENRDKPKELYIGNDVRRIGDVIGVYDFRARGIATGYSIASETAGGVANILGYLGTKSRGVLLFEALREGISAKGVARFIESEASSGNYGSASYVICDKNSIFNIESFGQKIRAREFYRRKFFVATNHLHILDEGKKSKDSYLREQYLKRLGKISEESVLKFATNHRNPAICRHGRTLASYVVFKRHNDKSVKILYSIGEPCKGYKVFPKTN